jgi:plastocyanin
MLVLIAVFVALIGWSIRESQAVSAQVKGNDNTIIMMDDCLPGDPGYTAETGGCQLKPHEGDVPAAEFGALLSSPLISGLVGHPSWRNEPSHVTANAGRRVRVVNRGGRAHTLTKVDNFGGGSVPPLNVGATRAPECPANPGLVTDAIPPGGSGEAVGLEPGLNKLQCCFHPWMRATIRVE